MFSLRLLLLMPLLFACAGSLRAAVSITRQKNRIILANGHFEVSIRPENGRFTLTRENLSLITGGYWSQVGRRQDGKDVASTGPAGAPAVTIDPVSNAGERGEVSITFAPGGREGGLPCEVEMRYTLEAGSRTLYLTSVWRHGPGMPGFSIAEARHAMKLNGEVFDYLAVDEKRHGLMPSGPDWDRALPLNLKEARRITTGPFAGKAEHKYGYSALIAGLPAYGWGSSRWKTGVWLINPSSEYLAGGPTKMELTGHLDVNRGGAPVLLNMWHGSHYGGSSLRVADDEVWSKVIGPFAVHLNDGADPEELWRAAIHHSRTEQAAWPYAWVNISGFPHEKERGSVRGRLTTAEENTNPRVFTVGLAAAPELSDRRGRPVIVDWQNNSRNYQFWATASPAFEIPDIRPGEYNLYAFSSGLAGEYVRERVRVEAGESLDLGHLIWDAESGFKTLWQIGIPDRSAGEFRRGSGAGTWGLYYHFEKDFPEGVNFTIGKSDFAEDWNYVHCGIPGGHPQSVRPVTWNVHFVLDSVPENPVSLRLGIAGNRSPSGVEAAVNGEAAGTTGPMPDTAVMHRDAVRGAWFERRIPIDSRLLKTGANTLSLTVPVRSWSDGVLYDFVRLEVEE